MNSRNSMLLFNRIQVFKENGKKNLFPYIKTRSFLLHWQPFFVGILNTTNYGIATFEMILISFVTFPCYIQTWFSKRFAGHFTLLHAYETVQYLNICTVWKHMYSLETYVQFCGASILFLIKLLKLHRLLWLCVAVCWFFLF